MATDKDKQKKNSNQDNTNQEDDIRKKLIEAKMKSLGINKVSYRTGVDALDTVEGVPTGIVEIDNILGDLCAIPEGTLVEFCGESGSGKTHVALCTIAEAQKMGGLCAFFNVESSLYSPRAEALGVQVSNPKLFERFQNIETAEQYGAMLELLVGTGAYKVIVLDSITAMIPETDFTRELSDAPKIGAHAQFINRLYKKLLNKCASSGTIVISINQYRLGQSNIPGGPMVRKATGGSGVEYFSHMRLDFDRIKGKTGDVIGDNNEVIGGKSKITIKKSRYGQPGLTSEFPIYYQDAEVNPVGEFLYVAQARNKEFIKVYRKRYQYFNKETGEILIDNINPLEFIKLLIECPAPDYKKANDNSANAFEYIANQLHINDDRRKVIIKALDDEEAVIVPPDDYKALIFENKQTEDEDDN